MAMSIRATAQTQESLVPTFTATIGGVEQVCVDARTLHAHLKNGDMFAHWINARIQKYGFEQGADYELIAWENTKAKAETQKTGEEDSGGLIWENPQTKQTGRGGNRRSKDYHLTLDMAKELSMVESNEQGRAARRYFINMERIAIQAIKDQLAQALEARPAIDYTRISPAQAQALKELVNAEVRKTGKHHQTVWTAFQHHFQVNSYLELPAARFDEACKWLGGKRIATKAAPATSYDVPAVDFDFKAELTTGLTDPKDMPPEAEFAINRHAWALAGQTVPVFVQFLQRYTSHKLNRADQYNLPRVEALLAPLTVDHCLMHRYFGGLNAMRSVMVASHQMIADSLCRIDERMGTIMA